MNTVNIILEIPVVNLWGVSACLSTDFLVFTTHFTIYFNIERRKKDSAVMSHKSYLDRISKGNLKQKRNKCIKLVPFSAVIFL